MKFCIDIHGPQMMIPNDLISPSSFLSCHHHVRLSTGPLFNGPIENESYSDISLISTLQSNSPIIFVLHQLFLKILTITLSLSLMPGQMISKCPDGHDICGHGGRSGKLLIVVIHQPFAPAHCHDTEHTVSTLLRSGLPFCVPLQGTFITASAPPSLPKQWTERIGA